VSTQVSMALMHWLEDTTAIAEELNRVSLGGS